MKIVKTVAIFIILMICFTAYYKRMLHERTLFIENDFVEYTLPSSFTGPASLEFKGITSDFLLFKFMAFIGGRIGRLDQFDERYWRYMVESLETITDLDPYYFDAYLFAEMFLTWEAAHYEDANRILMKAREYITDDYRIPYYIAFNYFWFLKDNANGAKYLMEAAKMAPSSRYYLATLAARLSAYADDHRVGIEFLENIIQNTHDEKIRKQFQLRIETLKALEYLTLNIRKYKEIYGVPPISLNDLVEKKLIDKIPDEPYGGEFIINEHGQVYTTSNMIPEKHVYK